jgi:hypothetical protein
MPLFKSNSPDKNDIEEERNDIEEEKKTHKPDKDIEEEKKTSKLVKEIEAKLDEEESSCIGALDIPVDDDVFGIGKYTLGLTSFITKCKTPMTIAIQGDWGSGKSSVMQMVIKELDTSKIHYTVVNTWQFSQFSSESNLPVALMQAIVDGIKGSGEDPDIFDKFKKNIAKIGVGVAKGLTSFLLEGRIGFGTAGTAAEGVGSVFDGFLEQNKLIQELRNRFRDCVYKAIKDNKVSRIAIFIDDLDRLEPERAVELLEVLKTFLDCKGCVFILAIDYNVVVGGIAKKYGEDTVDKEKGKSFFDKIIQVPFKMPDAMYDISNFVMKTLKDITKEEWNNDEYLSYKSLIEKSIGHNPRSMKRLFNSFVLQLEIAKAGAIISDVKGNKVLFSMLCMQLKYYELYTHIVINLDDIISNLDDYNIFADLADEDVDNVLEKLIELEILKPVNEQNNQEKHILEQYRSVNDFIRIFIGIIAEDGKAITQNDLENAKPFIMISAATAAGGGVVPVSDSDRTTKDERKELYDMIWKTPGIKRAKNVKYSKRDNVAGFAFSTENLEMEAKRIEDSLAGAKVLVDTHYFIDMRRREIRVGLGANASEQAGDNDKEPWKDMIQQAFLKISKKKSGVFTRHFGGAFLSLTLDSKGVDKDAFDKMMEKFFEYDRIMFGK